MNRYKNLKRIISIILTVVIFITVGITEVYAEEVTEPESETETELQPVEMSEAVMYQENSGIMVASTLDDLTGTTGEIVKGYVKENNELLFALSHRIYVSNDSIEAVLANVETEVTELSSELGVLEGILTTIETYINDIKVQISSLATMLENIYSRVGYIKTYTSSIQSYLGNSSTTALKELIEISDYLYDVNMAFDMKLSSVVSTLSDKLQPLTNIASDISLIKSYLGNDTYSVLGLLGTIKTDIKNLFTRVGYIKEDVATLKEYGSRIKNNFNMSISDLCDEITLYLSDLEVMGTNIGLLYTRAGYIKDDIATLKEYGTRIKNNFDISLSTLSSNIVTALADLKVLNTISTDIANLYTRVGYIKEDVATLKEYGSVIKNNFDISLNTLSSNITKSISDLNTTSNSILDAVSETEVSLSKSLSSLNTGLVKALNDVSGDIVDALEDGFESITEELRIIRKILNGESLENEELMLFGTAVDVGEVLEHNGSLYDVMDKVLREVDGMGTNLTNFINDYKNTNIKVNVDIDNMDNNSEEYNSLLDLLSCFLYIVLILGGLLTLFLRCLQYVILIFEIPATTELLNDYMLQGFNYLNEIQLTVNTSRGPISFGSLWSFMQTLIYITVAFGVIKVIRREINRGSFAR